MTLLLTQLSTHIQQNCTCVYFCLVLNKKFEFPAVSIWRFGLVRPRLAYFLDRLPSSIVENLRRRSSSLHRPSFK